MDRFPIFHREIKSIPPQNLKKNIWCPFYEDCLDEAAKQNSLMECSQCENANVNFEDDWRYRNIYCLL